VLVRALGLKTLPDATAPQDYEDMPEAAPLASSSIAGEKLPPVD
jgi:hypothetical protein